MGAYRSKPEKEKIYESGGNESIRFASCSMQGWRIHQEDAHNCIIDFMPKMSFFAVYDGHGGFLEFFYFLKAFLEILPIKERETRIF